MERTLFSSYILYLAGFTYIRLLAGPIKPRTGPAAGVSISRRPGASLRVGARSALLPTPPASLVIALTNYHGLSLEF